MNEFLRQQDFINPEELAIPFTIIGVGGIGSWTVLELVKMGCADITVFDPDSVEEHNNASQVYGRSDVGRKKVEALAEIIQRLAPAPIQLKSRQELFGKNTQVSGGIIISAVHSMESRAEIFERIKYRPDILFFVDGRMAGEVGRVIAVNPCDPDDVEFYEDTLFPDSKASEVPCTGAAVGYNTSALGVFIAIRVRQFIKGQPFPRDFTLDTHNTTCYVPEGERNRLQSQGGIVMR